METTGIVNIDNLDPVMNQLGAIGTFEEHFEGLRDTLAQRSTRKISCILPRYYCSGFAVLAARIVVPSPELSQEN